MCLADVSHKYIRVISYVQVKRKLATGFCDEFHERLCAAQDGFGKDNHECNAQQG